jgi:GGDEF domain-containing protein
VVLVEASEPGDLDPLVDRLRGTVTAPLDVRGTLRLRVGVSIGASWCPRGESDPRTLLRHADEQMYLDKRRRPAS